jgi:predicted metal-dependent hydrolase
VGLGEHFSIDLNGEAVPVFVRRNAQAKRLILRIDRATGAVKLTLPPHVSGRAATKFIEKQRGWIARERAGLKPMQPLGHGDDLVYLGTPHRLLFTGTAPRTIIRMDGEIRVGGPLDMAAKRLENWLKREAKRLLSERSQQHAGTLGVGFERISIGDMKSRWGSCSARGTLRYSWRLLMAPYEVLDYVAAHEVAHLREMNHSDRFWDAVGICVPDHKALRRWLKSEGNALFKVRF